MNLQDHVHPHRASITLVDRSPFPPHHAASTDINKIVRADYTTRFYMDLAYEALEAWKTSPNLAGADGRRFFHPSGWVALSNTGNDIAERIRANLRERGGDPSRDVEVGEGLRERWGGLLRETDFGDIVTGYENPEAGWADAGDAVKRLIGIAVEKGVRYVCGDVETLMLGERGVSGVRTKNGEIYEAEKVLLATGAWTSQILSLIEDQLGIPEDDRAEKQVTAAGVCVVHYKLDDAEYEDLKDAPVIIYGDRGEAIPPPRSGQLLKFTNARSFTNTITTPTGHKISVPPESGQSVVSERLKQETLDRIVRKVMPRFADRPVEYWRLCWDSISPSQDQLITQHPHPQLGNLYLAVGGSFHSWKFLPTIGKYVINVLNGVSNGEVKDKRWAWKTTAPQERGAHEKVVPRRELKDLED